MERGDEGMGEEGAAKVSMGEGDEGGRGVVEKDCQWREVGGGGKVVEGGV